jgi:probable HAF family extracellular repeat protein
VAHRVSHAYRARESTLEDLGTLGGSSSCAEGINDAGEIVGWTDLANGQGHAFVYTDQEGMIDLNTTVPASQSRFVHAAAAEASESMSLRWAVPTTAAIRRRQRRR